MTTIQISFWVLALLVALALVFDFMNGFHDAANSIATVVSTGVLKPHQAVIWAAFFNFVLLIGIHAPGGHAMPRTQNSGQAPFLKASLTK